MSLRYLPTCLRVLTREVPAITKNKLGQCFMCRVKHPGEGIFKIRGLELGLTPCLSFVSFTHVLKHKVNVIMNIKNSSFFCFFCGWKACHPAHFSLPCLTLLQEWTAHQITRKKEKIGGHVFMLGKAQVVA